MAKQLSTNRVDFYSHIVLDSTRRLLTLLDRNRFSPTYGCFDRGYWHYRTLVDFPSAVYQQGVLALTLLYRNDFNGNFCFKNQRILEHIMGGMCFWSDIQNKDGSFNEWFPNEHSFVATAFTSYAVSEALLILDQELKRMAPDRVEKVISSLRSAGLWLKGNADMLVLNHTAGAIASLYNIYLITGEDDFMDATREKVDNMLECQDDEGWFYEYEGADIGYLGVSIDYLAKYYQKSRDSKVEGALKRALDFLVYFIHPDFSIGGEYGSRNVLYLLPHGFEILSREFDGAGAVLQSLYAGIEDDKNITGITVDDRYFVFFFFPNYVQAFVEYRSNSGSKRSGFESPANYINIYSNAGIVNKRNENYHFACNFKKNGVFKLYSVRGRRLVAADTGYFGRLKDSVTVSTQWFNRGQKLNILRETEDLLEFEVNGNFIYVNYDLPLKNLLIPFRIFNKTLGRSGRAMGFFNQWLKEKFIVSNRQSTLELMRKVILAEDEIIIEDKIINNGNVQFIGFGLEDSSITKYSPTSRYFIGDHLSERILKVDDEKEILRRLNEERSASIRMRFSFKTFGKDILKEITIE